MSDELIEKLVEILRKTRPVLNPGKAALLVVDMQECQVRRDGAPYKMMTAVAPGLLDYFMQRVADVAEPNIVRIVGAARDCGMPIVFTKLASYDKDGRDLPRQIRVWNDRAKEAWGSAPVPHKDDPAARVVGSLEPREDEMVIVKTTSGVFTATQLEHLLKNMGVEQLVVCGVLTNMCVEGSARAGAELGFDVFVVDDACAAWSDSVHRASLRSFEMVFGTVVLPMM